MNNGLCPECGVELTLWEDREIEIEPYGETIVEVTLFCGICGYEQTHYED